MGRPLMEAPELEKYRVTFDTYNRKRLEEQREIARAIRARNEELYKEVVGLVVWAREAGYAPAEIANSMGVSRTTQVNYLNKWNDWYGGTTYEEIHGTIRGRKGEAQTVAVNLPDRMKVETKMIQIDAGGTMAPSHEFTLGYASYGMLQRHQGERCWYDHKTTGTWIAEIPDFALAYEQNWLAENA